MKIRWQVWVLMAFFICASFSLFKAIGAREEGIRMAQENWQTLEKHGQKTLLGLCEKLTEDSVEEGVVFSGSYAEFLPEKNPLICSSTEISAQKAYGDFMHQKWRTISLRMMVGFFVLCLLFFILIFLTGLRGKKRE